jgi:hypothetical protein
MAPAKTESDSVAQAAREANGSVPAEAPASSPARWRRPGKMCLPQLHLRRKRQSRRIARNYVRSKAQSAPLRQQPRRIRRVLALGAMLLDPLHRRRWQERKRSASRSRSQPKCGSNESLNCGVKVGTTRLRRS